MMLDIRRMDPEVITTAFADDARLVFGEAQASGDFVPVVIPTRNGAEDLPATLVSLSQSERPVLPIIIENNSTDNTLEVADRFGAVCLSAEGSKMGALQAGLGYVAETGCGLAVITDDDVLVRRDWAGNMENKLRSLNDGSGVVVCGTSFTMHGKNPVVDLAYTSYRAARDAAYMVTGKEFSVRGHNYGIAFDDNGHILEAVNTLDPKLFEGDAHALLAEARAAGAIVHTTIRPDMAVVTKGDRLSTVAEALRAVFGNERSDSYRQQYGEDYTVHEH
jgi:hypothetical protein